MVAFNFTKFIDKVASRRKRMTIRKTARAKPGDKLQLYTGMRTKACRKLVDEDAACLGVFKVTLSEHNAVPENETEARDLIGSPYSEYVGVVWFADILARQDGFDDWPAMRDWFDAKYGLPFTGYAHVWDWPDTPSPQTRPGSARVGGVE